MGQGVGASNNSRGMQFMQDGMIRAKGAATEMQRSVQDHMGRAMIVANQVGSNFSGARPDIFSFSHKLNVHSLSSCCEDGWDRNASYVEVPSVPSDSQMYKPMREEAVGEVISVVLQKDSKGLLGLDLDFVQGREAVPVRAVTGHAAQEWNQANPEKKVLAGDRIIDVNGTYGVSEHMVKELSGHDVLRITVVRIKNGEHMDDWEYVRVYQEKQTFEESTPATMRELVPFHGMGDAVTGQIRSNGFGDAVSGQIHSYGTVATVVPWQNVPIQPEAIPEGSVASPKGADIFDNSFGEPVTGQIKSGGKSTSGNYSSTQQRQPAL